MALRKFMLFHLSLPEIKQLSFETKPVSREEWLRQSLAKRFEFEYRAGRTLHWVPRRDIDHCIFGVIQQQKPYAHHLPPDQGGRETVSHQWQGAFVLLDPTHHGDGQRVAVEIDDVGQPTALLKALIDHINSDPRRPFTIEFFPIFDGGSFWRFSKRHSNRLKFVQFNFTVPNMWGAESELEKELRDVNHEMGAEKVEVKFQAKDGIKSDGQKVKDGVSYAEKGAGEVRAKSLDGENFSSRNNLTTSSVRKVDGSAEEVRAYFREHLSRIMRSDEDRS